MQIMHIRADPCSGQCKTYQLIKILPVVLRHESKSGQQSPTEIVEVRIAVVRIFSDFYARVILRARTENSERFKIIISTGRVEKIEFVNIMDATLSVKYWLIFIQLY